MAGVPSPADAPALSAKELIAYIRAHDGRVFRNRMAPKVFVLTGNKELADWLVKHEGRPFVPIGMGVKHDGSYQRAPGIREWDIVISTVPTTDTDPEAVWKAAGPWD